MARGSGKKTTRPRSKTKENGKAVGGSPIGLLALPEWIRQNPTDDPKTWLAAGGKPTCQGCVAHCCRYIAVEIDKPDTKWQYDQILWMLVHENVAVYVETDGEWFVEFKTKCGALGEANLCTIYEDRPRLCRDYSNETCPVWGEGTPYRARWEDAPSFAAWLDSKGINWRYKNGEGYSAPRITFRRPKKKKKESLPIF